MYWATLELAFSLPTSPSPSAFTLEPWPSRWLTTARIKKKPGRSNCSWSSSIPYSSWTTLTGTSLSSTSMIFLQSSLNSAPSCSYQPACFFCPTRKRKWPITPETLRQDIWHIINQSRWVALTRTREKRRKCDCVFDDHWWWIVTTTKARTSTTLVVQLY